MQVSKDQNFRNKKCKAMSLEGKHESNLLRATGFAVTTFKNLLALLLQALHTRHGSGRCGSSCGDETFPCSCEQVQSKLKCFSHSFCQIGNLGFAYGNCFFREWHVKPMGLQLQVSSDAFKALLLQSFGIKSTTCRSSRAELRKAAKTLGLPLKLADEITLEALKQLL